MWGTYIGNDQSNYPERSKNDLQKETGTADAPENIQENHGAGNQEGVFGFENYGCV